MGSFALRHVESSWTRDWTHVPCISRWTLNHWTTKEVPSISILSVLNIVVHTCQSQTPNLFQYSGSSPQSHDRWLPIGLVRDKRWAMVSPLETVHSPSLVEASHTATKTSGFTQWSGSHTWTLFIRCVIAEETCAGCWARPSSWVETHGWPGASRALRALVDLTIFVTSQYSVQGKGLLVQWSSTSNRKNSRSPERYFRDFWDVYERKTVFVYA